MMSVLSLIWDWLGTNGGKLGALAAVVGLAVSLTFNIFALRWRKTSLKVRRVDELVRQSREGAVADAINAIEEFWATEPGKQVLSGNYDAVVQGALDSAKNLDQDAKLHQIRKHFAEVARCVRQGHCDPRYAAEMYCDGVRKFLMLYEKWLEQESTFRKEDLGQELREFQSLHCNQHIRDVQEGLTRRRRRPVFSVGDTKPSLKPAN